MFRIIRHLRQFCDISLTLIKWPVAIFLFLSIIPILQSWWFYYEKVFTNWGELWRFIGGFIFIAVVWIFLVNRKNIVASALEHEITHAIFALLTFHNVADIEANYNGSGKMTFTGGKGNWLITIAPYFFPTLSVAIIGIAIITYIITGQVISWLNLALGVTIGYHFLAVLFEIHTEQTDLQKVSFLFAFMFIPAANLLNYALIFAFVDRGLTGCLHFLKVWYYISLQDIQFLIQFSGL